MEINKAGYYLNENRNLLVVYKTIDNITLIEAYVERRNKEPQWETLIFNEESLNILNSTVEFEYLGEL